jgi:hypothetical protein
MVDYDKPGTMYGYGIGYSYVRRGRALIAYAIDLSTVTTCIAGSSTIHSITPEQRGIRVLCNLAKSIR